MPPTPVRCAYCGTKTHAFIPPQYDGYIGHCPNCYGRLRLIEKMKVDKTDDPFKDIMEYKRMKEELIEKSQNLALHNKN